jgi:electron transfer flavoprotein alpha subunit
MKDASGILIVAEYSDDKIKQVSFELVKKARELADKIGTSVFVFVMGHNLKNIDEFGEYGADKIYYADEPALENFDDTIYANITTDLIKLVNPEIVLAPATPIGRSFIPRVATYLETGLTADCIDLDIRVEDRILIQKRPAWGGNMIADIYCPVKRPQMATVRPGVFKAEKTGNNKAETERINSSNEALTKGFDLVRIEKDDFSENKLNNCNVIFSVGRGVDPALIPKIKELARLLDAGVGCTRPLVEGKIFPHSCQIGQSGTFVTPKVCFSLGISGAIQYTVGIKGAENNIAVNRDSDAQIFEVSDFGIVSDVNKIIPLLLEKIREIKGIK